MSSDCVELGGTQMAAFTDPTPRDHLPAAFPLHLDIQTPDEFLTAKAFGAFHTLIPLLYWRCIHESSPTRDLYLATIFSNSSVGFWDPITEESKLSISFSTISLSKLSWLIWTAGCRMHNVCSTNFLIWKPAPWLSPDHNRHNGDMRERSTYSGWSSTVSDGTPRPHCSRCRIKYHYIRNAIALGVLQLELGI